MYYLINDNGNLVQVSPKCYDSFASLYNHSEIEWCELIDLFGDKHKVILTENWAMLNHSA